MSYLPELRKSFVKAAERQVAPVAVPARRRARWDFGALAIIGASVAALFVAGVVLVSIGHRPPTRPAPPTAPAPTSARAAAAQVVIAFRPPSGAVPLAHDPTRAHALRAPRNGLPVRSATDVHLLYRVPGKPQDVINAISVQRSLPGIAPGESTVGGAGGNPVSEWSSTTIQLAPTGAFSRELQALAVTAPGGGTALRIDAIAWPLIRRPVTERIPTSAHTVLVALLGPRPSSRVRSPGRLTGADAAETIAVLNSAPLVQPPGNFCQDTTNFRIRLTFLGTGENPAPVATVRPACPTADLTLLGRPQPRLDLGVPGTGARILRFVRFFERLEGLPRSKSLRSALTMLTPASSSSGSVSAPVPVQPARKP